MLINVLILQKDYVDFTSMLAASNIGYPHLLLCETSDEQRRRRIESYSLFIQLDDCHISNKIGSIGYRLFAGSLDKASLSDITHLEHRLFTFWKGLPDIYRLTESPMEYVNPTKIELLSDNIHILHLNQFYYASWLTLESRFMESPDTADLTNASLTKIDNQRALIIVSICSDTLTHLFQTLYQNQPCMLDLHWVLITTDVLRMLTTSTSESIRHHASLNLQRCLPILKSLMQPNLLPSSSSSSTQPHHQVTTLSPSSSSSTSAPSLITATNNVFSPSVSSISTGCDTLEDDYGVDDDDEDHERGATVEGGWTSHDPILCQQHHRRKTPTAAEEEYSAGLYFGGEIKKNLQSYFTETSI
ncbi:hypothetical protein BJ944DRAFT_269803 [Cunninghamella echinulata]|nr:hypothetical protein BJ944DRAFT_269803 [Cunninghamella echinulata]